METEPTPEGDPREIFKQLAREILAENDVPEDAILDVEDVFDTGELDEAIGNLYTVAAEYGIDEAELLSRLQ